MMKKAQQMRTMLPMGRREVMSVSTTSFNPGARLITLRAHSKCMSSAASPSLPPPAPIWSASHANCVPERAQGAQQPQDSEDTQDPVPAAVGQREEDVHQRNEHQQPVQDVPAGLEVGLLAEAEAQSYDLQEAPEETSKVPQKERPFFFIIIIIMITLMAISRRKITVKT